MFALKNPGEGCVDRVRSQKPLVRVCADRVRSQKPLVDRVLTVRALKNPGEG